MRHLSGIRDPPGNGGGVCFLSVGFVPAPFRLPWGDGSLRWARERTWGLLTLVQDGNLRRYLRWTMTAPVLILLLLGYRF